jgi:hypothetical protein
MNEACRIATDAFEKFFLILCCLSVASLMELAADVRSSLLAFCMVHHDLNLKVTVSSKPIATAAPSGADVTDVSAFYCATVKVDTL